MRTKAVLPALLAPTLALGVVATSGSAAEASSRPVTVTSLTAKNLSTNGGCKDVQIRVNYQAPANIDAEFAVKIWRGSHYLETVDLYEDHRGYKTGSFYWCYEGIGAFQVKGLTVDYLDWDADYDWSGTYSDAHATAFQVKQASNVYMSSLTRSKASPAAATKRLVTAVVRDRYYRNSTDAWTNRRYHYVYLQQKTAKGWKSVTRASTNRYGVATLRYVAPSARASWWRIYTPGNSSAWSDLSGEHYR